MAQIVSSSSAQAPSSSVVEDLRMKWSELEWKNIAAFGLLHAMALYGVAMIPFLNDYRYLYAVFVLYAYSMLVRINCSV